MGTVSPGRLSRLGVGLRIGPRPGGGHHRVKGDVADLVVLDLVDMPVNDIDPAEGLEQCLHLFGVLCPEVPALVDFLQGRMENTIWSIRVNLAQILLEPFSLRLSHHEGGAVRVVQPGHLVHPLCRAGPFPVPRIIRQDAVQHYEMDPLVVETVVLFAEEFSQYSPMSR